MEEKRKEFMSLVQRGIIKLNSSCYICGNTNNLQLHHIIPLSNGGDNRATNIITLCGECHGKVHNNEGLKMAREKIVQKKKGSFILINNQTNEEFYLNGWEEVSKKIEKLNQLEGYQYSRIKNTIITAKTVRAKASKIKRMYSDRLEYCEKGVIIRNFMFKGNIDLIIIDTKRKDGINT